MSSVRVRFAPSPTGPLHIGGVRTALYNFLFARKHKGTFILRIEDTDQVRYVPGAEEYIIESLNWFGLVPDEGPGFGGAYGPYRQSERKDLYQSYAKKLLESGHAYYSFDTPEELDQQREKDATFKYDSQSRKYLKNSLSLSPQETSHLLETSQHVAVRLKVEPGEKIEIHDQIRGTVIFDSSELDDKVILKADGMPTYHLANIVDDALMQITHVIRGEEWLSSTAHHMLLYKYLGYTPPSFAHLPLILKPSGQGKLSKRDGATFGFPVFPLTWHGDGEVFDGFREAGFLPEAVLNFLSLLGWNPGTDQELFSLSDLIHAFSIDKIVKSGARFDFEKAKWFNQQYIIQTPDEVLAEMISPKVEKIYGMFSLAYLSGVCKQMKERVHVVDEIITSGKFFFEDVSSYDEETIMKKYKAENRVYFEKIAMLITQDISKAEENVKSFIQQESLKMGDILPVIRIAISGSMQGPDLFQSMQLLGAEKSSNRIIAAIDTFDQIISSAK
jgi:glutamyl-tRNA synthetase